MRRICLSLVWACCFLSVGLAQSDNTAAAQQVQLVRAGDKTTYGTSPKDLSTYLMEQHIADASMITYKRAAFRLTIDHQGKVTGATRFFGGITPEIETKLVHAFLQMPAWKTTVEPHQQSVIYVVVIVSNQQITTEIY